MPYAQNPSTLRRNRNRTTVHIFDWQSGTHPTRSSHASLASPPLHTYPTRTHLASTRALRIPFIGKALSIPLARIPLNSLKRMPSQLTRIALARRFPPVFTPSCCTQLQVALPAEELQA